MNEFILGCLAGIVLTLILQSLIIGWIFWIFILPIPPETNDPQYPRL